MFFKAKTSRSARSFSAELDRLGETLARAETVVIGAGTGLSTSAGFTYTGERFREYFSDFAERYGIQDMYSGGFYPFPAQETWDNEAVIRQMMEEQKNMEVPAELIPHCPRCGKPVTMNLRSDDKFVQDQGWYDAAERYEEFLRCHADGNVLFLELGVGYNTPGIIKLPFWRQTAENPKASYACVNFGEAAYPPEIERQSICISGDIGNVVRHLIPSVRHSADALHGHFRRVGKSALPGRTCRPHAANSAAKLPSASSGGGVCCWLQ